MRITGGHWAGLTLVVPPGLGVRPTPDKVRQAIFNSLGELVLERAVLELFAGSGALSLECLSRGAKSALCVEKSNRHAGYLRQNIRALGANMEVRVQDAFTIVQQLAQSARTFSLIMADPPYGEKNTDRRSESVAQKLLDDSSLPSLLTFDGLFLLGHANRDRVEISDPWRESKTLKHGDNWIKILTVN